MDILRWKICAYERFVPRKTLKRLYNAIVQPHFDHADVVYDSAYKTNKALF